MSVGCYPSAVEECNQDGHTGSGHHHAGHGMCVVGHGIEGVGIGIQDGYRWAHDTFALYRVAALLYEGC